MNKDDKTRFTNALIGSFEVYGKQVSDTLINIWWVSMQSYSIDEFCHALSRHLQDPDTGQFVPKPADIVRALSGSKDGQALIAWSKVEKAMKSIGCHNSVCFDDGLINRLVEDMGGWIQLCSLSEHDLKFKCNEFEKRYKSYLVNPPLEIPSHLVGKSEQANLTGGFEVDPPMFVGNHKQAALIFQTGKSGAGHRIGQLKGFNQLQDLTKGAA